jgi:predicted dienelactone hydrolase
MRTLLLTLLLACTPEVEPPTDEQPEPPAPVAPDLPGPYAVGVRTHVLQRPGAEPLTIELWYPADAEPGEPVRYDPILPLLAHAARDAPADLREDLPLVVFSHGYGGVRFQSAFLTEALASHGFVVAAPDHPFNSLYELRNSVSAEVAARRPGDVSDVIDWLLGDGGSAYGVVVDPEAIGVVGHSFGAFTALAVGGAQLDAAQFEAWCAIEGGRACRFVEGQVLDPALVAAEGQPDPRVEAIVGLAPGGWYAFGPDGDSLSGVVPALLMAGTRDGDLPYDTEARPTWERLPTGARLATLHDGGHWAFSELCALLPIEDCAGVEGGYMAHERVQALTRTLVTAHLQVQLRGLTEFGAWLQPEGEDVDIEVIP